MLCLIGVFEDGLALLGLPSCSVFGLANLCDGLGEFVDLVS
jgi:hypothetical protein